MAEPNPSGSSSNKYGPTVTTPELALPVQINLPQPLPLPPPQPQNAGPVQHLNQSYSLPLVNTEPSFIPPNQAIAYQNPAGTNRHPNQTDHYISINPAGSSPAVPQQNLGLLVNSLGEQFLSHIIRQSISLPAVSVPTEQVKPPDPTPVLGSFNFRVEPIHLLHVNSSPSLLQNPAGSPDHEPNQTEQPPVKPKPPPSPPSPKAQPPELIVQPNFQPAPNNFSNTRNKHTKVFNNAGNLANLLPTGTVLAFQALIPSLSNNGKCNLTNKYLIAVTIGAIAVICLLSSFTDSLMYEEKVYYGLATPRGFYVFNYDKPEEEEAKIAGELAELRMKLVDFVHALGSLGVFLVFAFSALGVQSCYFPESSESDQYTLVTFLPLMTGVLSSFLFAVFPTKRRGIGYTPNMPRTTKA